MDWSDLEEPTDAFPQMVAKRFLIDKPIGAGTLGTTYRAIDASTEIPIALKVMHEKKLVDADAVSRFLLAGQTMMSIQHPHVVHVIDCGKDHLGHVYQAMELIDGVSLERALEAGYEFSELEALDVVLDLLTGAAQVHSRGEVHRDIQPKAVLLDPDGLALLADFGVVRQSDEAEPVRTRAARHDTPAGTLIGHYGYMAPEQRGDPHGVNATADIYSLGALIFRMLTGADPEILALGAKKREMALQELPTIVIPVVETATAWNAKDRFNSAHDMARQLLPVRDSIAKNAGKGLRGAEWMKWFKTLTPAPMPQRDTGPTKVAPAPVGKRSKAATRVRQLAGVAVLLGLAIMLAAMLAMLAL